MSNPSAPLWIGGDFWQCLDRARQDWLDNLKGTAPADLLPCDILLAVSDAMRAESIACRLDKSSVHTDSDRARVNAIQEPRRDKALAKLAALVGKTP